MSSALNLALKAEWTKLRTLPGTIWQLLSVVALTVLVSAGAAASVRCSTGHCDQDLAKISLTGVLLGQAVVAIVAVLVATNEYSTGLIHVTLTAMPRRVAVLAAKATIVTGLILLAGALGVAGSMLAGRLILPGLSVGDGPVLRAAVGSVLYLALIALLGLGIATMVRDTAVSIGAVLGLLYLFPVIAAVATSERWQRHLQQIGPMSAGLAVQATTHLDELPIGPWAGLGVLAAWAAGALLVGGVLLQLRDA